MSPLAIRRMARWFSLLSIAILISFVAGKGWNPTETGSTDLLLFAVFPMGMITGLIIGWWKEGIGGLLTIASLSLFYLFHWMLKGSFPQDPFFAILALPGLLFVIYQMSLRNRC